MAGLLAAVTIRFIGTFSVAEVLAVAFIPFLDFKKIRADKGVRLLTPLLFLWLIGVITSNIYNHTPSYFAIKGSCQILLLILCIPAVSCLTSKSPLSALIFMLGFGMADAIKWPITTCHILSQYWAIYSFNVLICSICALIYLRGQRWIAIIAMEFYSLISLWMGSRHLFLILSLSVTILALMQFLPKKNALKRQNSFIHRFIPFIFCLIVVGIASSLLYGTIAKKGYLGEFARAKYEIQSASNIGLVSGRIDFIISLYAISKKPILGYGSYPKDTTGIAVDYLNRTENKHVSEHLYPHYRTDRIPTHSYLLGAWINGGIAGAICWIGIITGIITFIFKKITSIPPLEAFYVVFLFMMLWDILFSPFAYRLMFLFLILPCFRMLYDRPTHTEITAPYTDGSQYSSKI